MVIGLLGMVLGAIFAAHGYLKMFGRALGPAKFADYLRRERVPAPTALAYAIGGLELGAGLCLLAGILVAVAGGLLAVHVALALVTVGPRKGFTRLPDQVGWEYELLLLASLLAVVFSERPAYSVGALLAR